MSRLTPGLITLDKGLDLNTAKIAAPEGTLLDSLNYEQVDFMGQKRIDGYVRYDGSLGSYQDELYVMQLLTEGYAIPEPGSLIYTQDGELLGVAVGSVGAHSYYRYCVFALLNDNYLPSNGDLVSAEGWGYDDQLLEVENLQKLSEFLDINETDDVITPSAQYEEVLKANQALRDRVTELPGPVAGLHWFNDRLYAVASVPRIDGSELSSMPELNEEIAGIRVLKVDGPYIYLSGSLSDMDEFIVGSGMASLYQSRTEQQALDELGDANLYGWDFIHQGWVVPFEAGISLYGSLPSLNQNIQGIGVQGPTNIVGSAGRVLPLYQNVAITNKPAQVNGWKDSTAPTQYTLTPSHLFDDDSTYIYADSFVSWDSAATAVTVPGATSGVLQERSPSSTIKVVL